MTFVSLVFAGLAAVLHVYIWSMEAFTWRQPATWKRFGIASQAEADTTAPLAYNQGFYNLFLAIVAGMGIILVAADRNESGWALVFAGCGSMIAAAAVLVTSNSSMARAALTQSLFAIIAVLFGVASVL